MSEEIHEHRPPAPMVQEIAFEITRNMKYNPKCLCNNTGCARHSNCRACMMFHKLTAHPPTCRYHWKWKPKDKKPERIHLKKISNKEIK